MRLSWIHSVTFAISLPVGVACTPLGLWIYEDPGVRVSRVRLGTDSLSLAPVLIALDVQNPNDYPVSTVHVQLSLELDDEQIGELNRCALPVGERVHRAPRGRPHPHNGCYEPRTSVVRLLCQLNADLPNRLP